MRRRIVSALLRIYPAGWRREYGPEFRDVLETLEPRARTVGNVVWNGVLERLRATEPWVLLGLPFMLIPTIVYIVMIVAPPAYDPASDARSVPAAISAIGLLVFLALPIGCGVWTVVRSGGTPSRAGRQTFKMALLIAAPSLVVSTLVLTGVLGVVVIGPGDTPTTIFEHGFAIAYLSADGTPPPNPMGTIVGGILMVLVRWFLGFIGGCFGENVAAAMRRAR